MKPGSAFLMALLLAACDTPPKVGETGQISNDPVDEDDDGFLADDDCDDSDPAVYPDAEEICDEKDNDCDGVIDEDVTPTWYTDADGDGYGDPDSGQQACTAPEGTVSDASDCDDDNAAVYPGASERCNGVDDDCDGVTDEDDAVDAVTWYLDADGDGYGDVTVATVACEAPSGTVAAEYADDCDDDNAAVYPGASEQCNSVDDDCDGAIDEDDAVDAVTWYLDADGDGYGDVTAATTACEAPSGHLADGSDCDDDNAEIHPGAAEVIDGIDNDCDGVLLFPETDSDGDGLLAGEEALWLSLYVDSNHASPDNTAAYGGAEAAALLADQGFSITSAWWPDITFDADFLAPHSVILLLDFGSYDPLDSAETAALQDWIEAGGGLLWVGGSATPYAYDNTNNVLSGYGLSCTYGGSHWTGSVTSWGAHDITSGLSSAGGAGGDYWTATSPAEVVAWVSSTPFLVVMEPGDGRVVALADEWPLYNASTTSYCIGYGDHSTMFSNIWAWLSDW